MHTFILQYVCGARIGLVCSESHTKYVGIIYYNYMRMHGTDNTWMHQEVRCRIWSGCRGLTHFRAPRGSSTHLLLARVLQSPCTLVGGGAYGILMYMLSFPPPVSSAVCKWTQCASHILQTASLLRVKIQQGVRMHMCTCSMAYPRVHFIASHLHVSSAARFLVLYLSV